MANYVVAMSGEALTNAMVEFARRRNEFLNSCSERPTSLDHFITDDWTMTDQRSGGVNFGQMDASGWTSFVGLTWDIGGGRPHFSIPAIVAVRGERCAAMVQVIDYEDGPQTEFILCLRLDAELGREQRSVAFDLDDVDAAIA